MYQILELCTTHLLYKSIWYTFWSIVYIEGRLQHYRFRSWFVFKKHMLWLTYFITYTIVCVLHVVSPFNVDMFVHEHDCLCVHACVIDLYMYMYCMFVVCTGFRMLECPVDVKFSYPSLFLFLNWRNFYIFPQINLCVTCVHLRN